MFLFLKFQLIQSIARFIFGGIFIYAGFGKLLNPIEFSRIIQNYKILPEFLINPVSIILPTIELIFGIFLISGIFIRGSAIVLSSLLIIFITVITINIIRGIDFNCGCFLISSNEHTSNGFLLIVRDLLILIPGIIIILFHKEK